MLGLNDCIGDKTKKEDTFFLVSKRFLPLVGSHPRVAGHQALNVITLKHFLKIILYKVGY